MSKLARDENSFPIQAFALPVSGVVTLAVGLTSAATAVLPAGIYRISTDVDCFILRAATVAATTGVPFTVANSGEIFEIGDNDKIAAITAVGTGNLKVVKL